MSKQTRKRELDRLRARREAERQRARRRRALLTYGTLGLVLVVAAVAGGLWLTGDDDTPAGAAATTAATATTAAFDDARAHAEAIAAKAGVSRPTIYRYWPNAQAVAMAAFLDASGEPGAGKTSRSPLAGTRRRTTPRTQGTRS
jgi:hypothetical protein